MTCPGSTWYVQLATCFYLIHCLLVLSFFIYFYGFSSVYEINIINYLKQQRTIACVQPPHPLPSPHVKIWEFLVRWRSDRTQTTYQWSYKINNIILFLLSKGFQRQPYCYYWNRSLSGYSRIILHTVSIFTRVLKVLESRCPQVSIFIEKTVFFSWLAKHCDKSYHRKHNFSETVTSTLSCSRVNRWKWKLGAMMT